MTELFFNSLHSQISDGVSASSNLVEIFSPYMKINALKEILKNKKNDTNVCLVINLKTRDLKFGAIDKEVISYSMKNGIYVYVNNMLHMKTYLYDRKKMHIGSANCTNSGLGLNEKNKHELLAKVNEIPINFLKYCEFIKSKSILLDADKYEQIREYLDLDFTEVDSLDEINRLDELLKNKVQEMTQIRASQLPLMASIDELYERLDENSERALHDVGVFNLNGKKFDNFEEYRSYLKDQFFNHIFVKHVFNSFDESINFGGVRRILEKECIDDPRPTREDINSLINNFFNWLEELGGENYEVKQPNHTKIIFKL